MIRESISIDDALEVLNRMLTIDPDAMRALVNYKVRCNDALVDDPEIQVSLGDACFYRVGCLGLINGLFGSNDDGCGSIGAVFDLECCMDANHDSASSDIFSECPECGSNLKIGTLLRFERTLESF